MNGARDGTSSERLMRHTSRATLFWVLVFLTLRWSVTAAPPLVLPPSFPKPIRSTFPATSDLRFTVRIVPHPDLRLLRLEALDLEPVPLDVQDTLPVDVRGWPSSRDEPIGREPIRSSEEPLPIYPGFREDETYHQWRTRVQPQSLYDFRWPAGALAAGRYELRATVVTSRHTSVSVTRPIQVL